MNNSVPGPVTLLMLALAASGCGSASAVQKPAVIQPGAPGETSKVLPSGTAQSIPQATGADIAFMQGMIHHHAQALDMTDLLETRSQDPDMKKLAMRIRVAESGG